MTILNDVLDFSKMEAGRLDLESIEFDPRVLLDGVLDTLAVEADRKGLEFVGDVDARVPGRLRGDPGRLRQILVNLGSNALKFTERGEVVIRLEPAVGDRAVEGGSAEPGGRASGSRPLEPGGRAAPVASPERDARMAQGPAGGAGASATWLPSGALASEDAGGAFVLRGEVHDTGIGIAREQQPGIFQAFTQADSSMSRRFGGTGLGLAIAQRLVQQMGGAIGVEGDLGEGSTFWFTALLEAVAAPPRRPSLPSGLRILVVDDQRASREHLLRVLHGWGCHAAGASDGVEACALLGDAARDGAPFGLVLLDLAMPDPDGLTTARWIRAATWGSTMPIVALVAPLGLRATLAPELGFTMLVAKPVKEGALLAAVQGALARPAVRGLATSGMARRLA